MQTDGTAVHEDATPTSPRKERRSQTVAGKLRRGQRTIEQEIERNHGAYPFNSGWLTEAEVCRRAGVAPDMLVESPEGAEVRGDLEAWLRKLSAPGAGTPTPANAEAVHVTANLKAQLEQIAVGYQQANLEVAALRERFKELEERERVLVETYAKLDAELTRHRMARPGAQPAHDRREDSR